MKDLFLQLRKRKGLLVIIIAALLLEMLSAAQYYYTHHLMEVELEKYAEMELTTKAIITKNIIGDSERTLKGHIMEVKYNLSSPDSMFNIVAQVAKYSPNLRGCGISFVPGYYKDKGELFEPYALRTDTGVVCLQVAGDKFDYTKDGFYRDIMEKKANSWVGPYDDIYLEMRLVSYAVPIYEFTGDTVAVFGVDIDTRSLGSVFLRFPSHRRRRADSRSDRLQAAGRGKVCHFSHQRQHRRPSTKPQQAEQSNTL